MSKFLEFSESLERDLSNDVLQIQHFVGAIISHFSALDHGLLLSMVLRNWQIRLSLKYEF